MSTISLKLGFTAWLDYVTELLKKNRFYLEKQSMLVYSKLDPQLGQLTPEVEKAYREFFFEFSAYCDQIILKWKRPARNQFEADLRDYELKLVSCQTSWSQFIISRYLKLLNNKILQNYPRLELFPGSFIYSPLVAGFKLPEFDCPTPFFPGEKFTAIQTYERLLPNIFRFYIDDFQFLLDLAKIFDFDYLRASYWISQFFRSIERRNQKAELLAIYILKKMPTLEMIFPAPNFSNRVVEKLTLAYQDKLKKTISGQVVDLGRFIYVGYGLSLFEEGHPLIELSYDKIILSFPFQKQLIEYCATN